MKYLYETHMHTSPVSACAASSPASQARAYKRRDYAGIIVTDHFTNGNSGCPPGLPWDEKMAFFASGYEEAKKEGGRCGLDVFFGWEFNVEGTEFLTYGLSLDFLLAHPDMDKLPIRQYSGLVRSAGGYLAQAHPFRTANWIRNPGAVAPDLMDGVEVYNAGIPDEANTKAFDFARLHGLPVQAGSDSHHEILPFSSGIALPKKAESIADIIDAIKTNRAELILPDRMSGQWV
ncbi:MAG: PHP domain-containing protein [Oscillospiraceae bacterium]|jgi:hypothetical protein|nr:PHP domain-containing protein [Oscillospiraceae bacterium]